MTTQPDGAVSLLRRRGHHFRPRQLLTATDRYRNCLRLSLSGPWNSSAQQAIARIGEIAREMLNGS
jgi:DNA-binding transcriptional MocR family regulator